MKKIISLFQRNYETDRLVRNEVVPGAEWVLAGEGTPTRKLDGTACLVKGGRLYKRFDAKVGRALPAGFEPTEPAPDAVSGHWPGWVPVGDELASQWHREAWRNHLEASGIPADGTYELLGPKIQGNPEGMPTHVLVPHNDWPLSDVPRDFAGIRDYLRAHGIEGIVWWRDIGDPDCDKVKIKAKDFGIKRVPAAATSA